MSAIIKSAAAGLVVRDVPAPLGQSTVSARVENGPERLIAELEAQVAELRREAVALQAEIKAAFVKGEAEGRKVGQGQAEDREHERVAALATGIATSQKALAEALAATEGLAAVLAKSCLDKLFGEEGDNVDRVCALLRVQMAQIERRQLIAVDVSAKDFSEDALTQVRAIVASDAVVVRRRAELGSGACKLQPRLGEIDIGLDVQWPAVAALLDRLAGAGAS